MKLSDVKGERTLDVVADIIEPMCNIAEDEQAAALFRREKLPEGMTAREFALKRLKKGIPALVKAHKADIIAILASVEGVSPQEYAKSLNLLKLIHDFTEFATDDEMLALFSPAQTGGSSGSAPENIKDSKA